MINCICCSKNLKKKFIYLKKPFAEKIFKLSKKYKRYFYLCDNCGHMIAKHFFSVPEMYTKQYFELVYGSLDGLERKVNFILNLPLKKSDNKNRVLRIQKFFNFKKNKVLDIGSGSGVFLSEMKKKGWDCLGLEKDKRYVNFCKKNLKLKIENKNLKNIKKKFDLITFNKVLEHVFKPEKFLSIVKKNLKEEGYVYIEVPDVVAAYKGKNRQEFGLEHFHVFSVSSLDIMINKAGFRTIHIERIQDPSGKYTLYAFAKKNYYK